MTTVFSLHAPLLLSQADISRLSRYVSAEKQDRISRSQGALHKQTMLLADLLLRSQLCAKTGLKNHELRFAVNPHGKPKLLNMPDVHYNISHSGPHMVCAIGEAPLGIDIEILRPIDLKIAKRFFAPDEFHYIRTAPAYEQQRLFFEIWTKKEAYIKYRGEGLFSAPLQGFSVLGNLEGAGFDTIAVSEKTLCHMCREDAGSFHFRAISMEDFLSRFHFQYT